MIKATSIALLIVLGNDGGTDVPVAERYVNADAGVYEVESALTYSGIMLGEGWWHSRDREQKIGTALIEKDNKLAQCQAQTQAQAQNQIPPWQTVAAIAALAFAGGVALTLFAVGNNK